MAATREATQTVKVLLNIGLDHQDEFGLPDLKQDEVAEVTASQAHILVNVLKVARSYDEEFEEEEAERVRQFDESVVEGEIAQRKIREDLEKKVADRMARPTKAKIRDATKGRQVEGGTEGEEEGDEGNSSPMEGVNVPDATDSIGRMTSKKKLQAIVSNDMRESVVEAAQRRLEELP